SRVPGPVVGQRQATPHAARATLVRGLWCAATPPRCESAHTCHGSRRVRALRADTPPRPHPGRGKGSFWDARHRASLKTLSIPAPDPKAPTIPAGATPVREHALARAFHPVRTGFRISQPGQRIPEEARHEHHHTRI